MSKKCSLNRTVYFFCKCAPHTQSNAKINKHKHTFIIQTHTLSKKDQLAIPRLYYSSHYSAAFYWPGWLYQEF